MADNNNNLVGIELANYKKEMAKTHEDDLNYQEALDFYTEAAKIYEKEGSIILANHCFSKVAQFLTYFEKFQEAAQIYEKIVENNIDNYEHYLFKAAICHLCSGVKNLLYNFKVNRM